MAIATPDPTIETRQSIEELELNAIAPAKDNPRRDLGDLTELVASMAELGLLQPLVVTPREGKFLVVCGHRRYAAAKTAKLGSVPAIVRELDAARVGTTPTSSGYEKNISTLKTLGVIDYPDRGYVVALPVLFLEEAA